jgi:hypothetical protein
MKFLSLGRALAPLAAAALAVVSLPALAVDGVVLIDQSRALAGNVTPGDAPGFPILITRPGSYRLASDLVVSDANAGAISITAEYVTLDLNGFSIRGPGTVGLGRGIKSTDAAGGGDAVTVMNGSVTGFGSHGVALDSNCFVENLRVANNRGDGIQATSGSIVKKNIVAGNQGDGIRIGLQSLVMGNIVSRNTGIGIVEGFPMAGPRGAMVLDNAVSQNGGLGMSLGATSGYARNAVTDNTGGTVVGGIQTGPNICNAGLCP